MPFTNSRNAYEFDPQDYDYQSAGGLPGLLRDAMQREALQNRNDPGAWPNPAFSQLSDQHGNPQGLLGRLLAFQTTQGLPDDRSSSVLPLASGANWKPPLQDSPPGRSISEPRVQLAAVDRPPQMWRSDPLGVEIGGGGALGGGLGGGAGGRITSPPSRPPWPVAPPPSEAATSTVPEWWSIAKRILQLSPMSSLGSGGDREDPIIETFRRCMRAAKRNTQAWEDFCDDLPPDAKELRAVCYSNAGNKQSEKENFCRARFTPE